MNLNKVVLLKLFKNEYFISSITRFSNVILGNNKNKKRIVSFTYSSGLIATNSLGEWKNNYGFNNGSKEDMNTFLKNTNESNIT